MRGTVLRGLTRRNLIAIAAGVLLAGAPLVAFDFWLGDFIEKAAQAEISVAARRAVALAEGRIDQVRAALDAAAEAGVRDCNPAAVTAMRQAAFDAAPIKDVLLIGPAGQTLCSGAAMPLGSLQLVSSHPLSGEPGLSLDIMRAPGGTTMIRLRRKVGASVNELAALMPARLLLPQASLGDRRTSAYIALVTADGQVIGTAGVRPRRGEPSFTKRANVAPLGMAYDIVVPRALVPATRSNIELIANIAVGGVLLLVALFVLFMRRRAPRNPVAEMERALKAGEFVPYYQPIVDIASGQLRGAEVLVRWRKPDGTLVSPGSFIPLAESSGLIRPMTRHLMKAICREAGEAIGRRPTLKISFNFAGYLFSDPTIVNEVRNAFAGGPIRFSQVVLEVTERDPIENFTETRRTIAALQELGVRIAIDDVGTGHSGLSYLLKLGVDIIKIDKIFVDAVGTDRNSTTIVETLVDLARNMRMDVIAEGVENFEQVMHLRKRGITQAQGFVFSPPLPGSSFLRLVEAIDPAARQEDASPRSEPRHADVAARTAGARPPLSAQRLFLGQGARVRKKAANWAAQF
jgi:sensor c-di-GMP phosphodiesterase-like protein